jgi:choline dehydrogenase-like flavoprotein
MPSYMHSVQCLHCYRLVSIWFVCRKQYANTSTTVTYIDSRGQRVSAESAYLTPKVLSRPNLKVAIHAQVTRILFDKTGGTLRAIGVEFANTPNGPRFRARARKEVIVSYVCSGHL